MLALILRKWHSETPPLFTSAQYLKVHPLLEWIYEIAPQFLIKCQRKHLINIPKQGTEIPFFPSHSLPQKPKLKTQIDPLNLKILIDRTATVFRWTTHRPPASRLSRSKPRSCRIPPRPSSPAPPVRRTRSASASPHSTPASALSAHPSAAPRISIKYEWAASIPAHACR